MGKNGGEMDVKDSSTILGEALRAQRTRLGLSQQEVADLSGVSINVIRQVEAGKPRAQLTKVLDILTAVGLQFTITPGRAGIAVRVD